MYRNIDFGLAQRVLSAMLICYAVFLALYSLHFTAGVHPNYAKGGIYAGVAVVAALLALAIRPQRGMLVQVHYHETPAAAGSTKEAA